MQDIELLVSDSQWLSRGAGVQDNIPATKARRNALLRIIREYVAQKQFVPPLSIDEIKIHSEKIVKIADTQDKFRNYIAVLFNNEVWREMVALIPFDKRLLLLPKCLRNPKECQGQIDTYGLVCRHCGKCPIHNLQTEAESLGYSVLVAEGSPVVMAMIESGQIEAVIGVSCLAVLEQVFPYIDAAAVPGMAIPLLRDGCTNTSVDLDWVWDAIHITQKGSTLTLNLDKLKLEVDSWFQKETLEKISGPLKSQTEVIGYDWLAKYGKRWRPFLAAGVYRSLAGRSDKSHSPVHMALAVECFHKASLIHDDIEDHDYYRYGVKALHQEHGLEIALNVGDFLLGEGYRLISESPATTEQKARMLQVAAQGHRDLCLGQGAELCWRRDPRILSTGQILQIFRQKTAPAFDVALHFGAIFAGADNGICQTLRNYSHCLGVAYQIHDDLQDFSDTTAGNDIHSMRPTLLPALAYEMAGEDEKKLLEAYWKLLDDPDHYDPERIAAIIRTSGALEKAEEMLEIYKSQAIQSLSELKNSQLKGLLRRVMGKIFNDIESLVCCYEYKTGINTGPQQGPPAAG
ncbi:MAG: polyprenyl synthetase family protein [Sedimentisphaerales bacterium]|nr:polyprenyl synthetase family protein [Sedimentisphaerales bacterium]